MRGMEMPVGALLVTPGPGHHRRDRRHARHRRRARSGRRVAPGGSRPIRAVLGTRGVRRAPRRSRLCVRARADVARARSWAASSGAPATAARRMSGLYGISLTMAMFVGIALLAPFVIIPLVRLLAVPLRKLFPGRRAAGRRRAALERRPHRRHRGRADHRPVGRRRQQHVVGELHGHGQRPARARASRATSPSRPPDRRSRPAAAPACRSALAHAIAGDARDARRVADPRRFPRPARDRARAEAGHRHRLRPRGVRAHGPRRRSRARRATAALRGVAARRRADRAAVRPARAASRSAIASSCAAPRATRSAPVVGVLDGITDFGGNVMQISLDTMRSVYGVTTDAQLAVRARSDAAAATAGAPHRGAPPRATTPASSWRRSPTRSRRSASQVERDVQHVQLDRRHRGHREPARRRSTRWRCPCSSARARSASCAPSARRAGRSGARCSTRACSSAAAGAITGVRVRAGDRRGLDTRASARRCRA